MESQEKDGARVVYTQQRDKGSREGVSVVEASGMDREVNVSEAGGRFKVEIQIEIRIKRLIVTSIVTQSFKG